jgi:orotate phosphoribosyltransferase
MEVTRKEHLCWISPSEYEDRILTLEEILHWFDLCDAAWVHDGDPKKPHAELTSGMCSNGYFDCARVLCYPNLCEILARQLIQRMIKKDLTPPDYVIGSAYAAITFSYEVAKILRYFYGFSALHGFVEKDPTDPKGKRMLWQRMKIPAGSSILQVEELITTSGTMTEVQRAVKEGQGEDKVNFLPIVGALVHRPPKLPADYGDRRVIALIEKEIWAVDPKDCPLCKVGSPRYRPKTHWLALTGKK